MDYAGTWRRRRNTDFGHEIVLGAAAALMQSHTTYVAYIPTYLLDSVKVRIGAPQGN